ncbi:MAG: PIN domain-containing protein [Treponema sp.]|nr:PIN domain-containing protein [Treponema sp.]
MSIYALDSNIVSFYLKGNSAVIENIEKAIDENHSIIVTPIAYYEVKRGLLLINAVNQLNRLMEFCDLFSVGEFGDHLLDEAVNIYVKERKARRNTEDADIFIAAFCLHNNYILVTDNTRHFENIENLQIINWSVSQEEVGKSI